MFVVHRFDSTLFTYIKFRVAVIRNLSFAPSSPLCHIGEKIVYVEVVVVVVVVIVVVIIVVIVVVDIDGHVDG